MKEKILVSWSGGKDSTLTLYELQRAGHYHVCALLTTMTEGYDRISMHGVRRILLEQQASSLELPLEMAYIPRNCSNAEYEHSISQALARFRTQDVCSVAAGDIFLEDVKSYRESLLARNGMQGIFPIWNRNSVEIARSFIDTGFQAIITCVDSHVLDQAFVGRVFNEHFLNELPSHVDPCGENGEFHSFVYDGPIFQRKICCTTGDVILRDNRFYYCDLLPDS
jgi:uncharacterized protein (TIGR00290 family)